MFEFIGNLFALIETTAKSGLFVVWLVMLVFTAAVTRLNLKAIVTVIVVGMIVLGVANNSDLIKTGGDKTVKEIKNGTTNGLPAPLRHSPTPRTVADLTTVATGAVTAAGTRTR